MDGVLTLLSLSVVMAVASILAGLLPLSISLNSARVRLISTIGMGVLVGTSLVIIIPEGVGTLYSASLNGPVHVRRTSRTWYSEAAPREFQVLDTRGAGDFGVPFIPGPVQPGSVKSPPSTPALSDVVGIMNHEEDEKDLRENPKGTKDGHREDSPHTWIGVALISGFILMYLVDKVPSYAFLSRPKTQPYHISLNDLRRGRQRGPSPGRYGEVDGFSQGNELGDTQRRSFATTIGLVTHATADGIALGASSSSANTGLSFIIFLAIMVHKAPAAFGLTSVLLKQGLSKQAARAHLLLFSLAAPVGAISTWLIARFLGAGAGGSAHSTDWWTAILLLFSGGTFLYVAMHAMQEVSSSNETQMNSHANGAGGNRDAQTEPSKPSLKDLIAAVIGMTLPLFLQLGHAH